VRFGGRLEVFSGGTRCLILRSHGLGLDDNPGVLSPSAAASSVDEWCEDATAWPYMLEVHDELTGARYRPPTSTDEAVKWRLRRAFEDGELVVVEAALFDGAAQATEVGAHAQATKVDLPSPPASPRRPVSAPKTLHHFALRLVDELGSAVSGVDIHFVHGGSQEDGTTDGNGVARVEDSAATTAKARVVDAKALREALKPRWAEPRGDRKWLDESQGVTVVRLVGDERPSFDLVADKLRIVSMQPYVTRVRLLGGFFDTEKCFPLPVALEGIRSVARACSGRASSALLVVGHTDSAGKPAYNDKLSLERAVALKDYLTDNVDGWMKWYGGDVAPEKRWARSEDGSMILALPDAAARRPGEDPVRWYQATRGLTVDGIAGPKTRRALVTEYMALEGTSLPKGVEATTHGCGEHYPDVPTDDTTTAPANRRVECFVFDRALGVQPAPTGANSAKGAPQYPEWCRRAAETEDHSYDFARIRVQPRLGSRFDYVLRVGGMAYDGSFDESGIIDHQVPADAGAGVLTIHLPDAGETYEWQLQIGTLESADDVAGMQQRLANLGYHSGAVTGAIDEATTNALRLFQEDFDLKVTGEYDPPTRQTLQRTHDELAT
jgi:outer membrane protein OmpA-like peptidoglycan-associated protein